MFRFFLIGFGKYGKAVFLCAFELNGEFGGSKLFFTAVFDKCLATQVGKPVEELVYRGIISGLAIRSLPYGLLVRGRCVFIFIDGEVYGLFL